MNPQPANRQSTTPDYAFGDPIPVPGRGRRKQRRGVTEMAACRSGDGTPRQLRTDRTGALDVMAALMLRTLRPLSSLLFRRAKHGREEPAFGATDSPGLPDKESAQAWRQWLDAVGDLKCADDFEPNRLPAAG